VRVAHTNSLFEEPWWLDAVAPGTWRAVEVRRDNEIWARLVVDVRRKGGVTLVRNPTLTQTIGPWLRPFVGKQASALRHEIDLVTELVALVPKGDITVLTLSAGYSNPHPFHWAGFDLSVGCTYRLTDLTDQERLWADLTEGCRRQIRKAQRSVTVRDDLSMDELFAVSTLSWARQHRRPPFDATFLQRVGAAAAAQGSLLGLGAEGADGKLHAAICVIRDERAAHYWIGGGDPELRNSGAHSLLIWEAICRVAGRSAVFDFEGTMNQQIEHFFRGFGPERTNLLSATKRTMRGVVADRVHKWMSR
jgi:hypothetical protein